MRMFMIEEFKDYRHIPSGEEMSRRGVFVLSEKDRTYEEFRWDNYPKFRIQTTMEDNKFTIEIIKPWQP